MNFRSKPGTRRTAIMMVLLAVALALPAVAGARSGPLSAAQSLFGSPPRSSTKGLLREARVRARRARSGRELTAVLAELSARMRTMSGSDRKQAVRLLARPTDGASDPQQNGYSVPEAVGSPYCTAHFCVHWVATGTDAPALTDANGNGIPDYVETVAAVAENVYSVENGQLGWHAPKGDGTIGGGVDKTDIYLKDLGGTGIYGYTSPDPGEPTAAQGHSLWAYLVIDNSFSADKFPRYASPLTPLEVTLAHEYNHVLQFNYDALEDTWMFESTAVWMEGKVYQAAHDYYQYLPGWVALPGVPLTTFDGQNPNDRANVKVYGSAVWTKWLDARYGQDVVRASWEDSTGTRPASFAPAAFDAAIRSHGGKGFFDAFSRFAAATSEWQAQNSGFPEGGAYPDVQRIGSLAVNAAPALTHLDHTTFSLVDVPHTDASRIKLIVSAPSGTAASIGLVGRTGGIPGGTATTALAEIPHGGAAAVAINGANGFSRLTAVLVNADVSESGYSQTNGDWVFTRNGQAFVIKLSTDFRRPHAKVRSPRSGARGVGTRPSVTITFTKPVIGVSTHSIELIGPNGRAVRERVRLKSGSRSAVLTPVGRLARRSRYQIRVVDSITDTALNHLFPARTSFSTG